MAGTGAIETLRTGEVPAADGSLHTRPHTFLFKMEDKLEMLQANTEAQPFIDSQACVEYSKYFQDWLTKRLEEERP